MAYTSPLEFERIITNRGSEVPAMYRAKVPGGWLLITGNPKEATSTLLLPDVAHKWRVLTEEEEDNG